MKNLFKFCLLFIFVLASVVCFSQVQTDTTKSAKPGDKSVKATHTTVKKEKDKTTKSPASKGKSGTTEQISVSDHSLPADKSTQKKSADKDKAVLPKKQ